MRNKSMLCGAVVAADLMLWTSRAWSAGATGVLTGHLKDAYGKPAEGIKVELARKAKKNETDPPATQPDGKAAPLSATTDSDGAFEIDNVPAGQYDVKASKDKAKAQTTVNIIAGRSLDVKMQMVVKGKKKPAPAN